MNPLSCRESDKCTKHNYPPRTSSKTWALPSHSTLQIERSDARDGTDGCPDFIFVVSGTETIAEEYYGRRSNPIPGCK